MTVLRERAFQGAPLDRVLAAARGSIAATSFLYNELKLAVHGALSGAPALPSPAVGSPGAVHAPPTQSPATPMDLMRLMRIIRSGPFRGYVPIETLAQPGILYDPFVQVPIFLKSVRDAIAQTAAG